MTGTLDNDRAVGRARSQPDTNLYSGRVAARLRALREKRRLSVDELAERLGLPVQTLYGYESGKAKVPPDLYPVIADAFGLTVRGFLPDE